LLTLVVVAPISRQHPRDALQYLVDGQVFSAYPTNVASKFDVFLYYKPAAAGVGGLGTIQWCLPGQRQEMLNCSFVVQVLLRCCCSCCFDVAVWIPLTTRCTSLLCLISQEVVDIFTGKQSPNLQAPAARDAVPERCEWTCSPAARLASDRWLAH
jgi:hypothetical protein